MANQKVVKYEVISCEKSTKQEDIAKGLFYKAKIIVLTEYTCKSPVELESGGKVETISETGYYQSQNDGLVPWFRLIRIIGEE